MKFLKKWKIGYILIAISLLISFCDNVGIYYNPKRKIVNRFINLEKKKLIPISNIGIDKLMKNFYEPTETDNGSLIQEFEYIFIQGFSTFGKKGANIILVDNDYDNWKYRNTLCSFEELEDWAYNDKTMAWIIWFLAFCGLFIEVSTYKIELK